MKNQNAQLVRNWLESVKEQYSTISNKLYLKYKGKEYKEKLDKSDKALQELFKILSEDPRALEHLREVSEFLDFVIKENRTLSIKEILYSILRIVGYVL